MAELTDLGDAAGRRRRAARRGASAAHRRLAHRREARGRPVAVRELPALLALLPRLGDHARRRDVHRLRPRLLQGLRDLRRRLSRRRDRDGAGMTRRSALLTGGEAVAHAMRQIDPDVVPVYPITPQTPIIQTFAKLVADGKAHDGDRQRRVRALRDERRDRRRARRRAHDDRDLVAGARADGRGRLHRRLDARADRDGARQPRALGADQHPLRPLRLDADPRLRRRPALRRERAGGVRPDGDGAADRRAPATCCCRCSSAWTASRSRTRPSRSRCFPTTRSRASSATYRIPNAVLDIDAARRRRGRSRCPTTTSSCAASRRPRSRPRSTCSTRSRPSSSGCPGADYGALEEYRLDDADARDRRARLHGRNGQGRRRRAARRARAGRAPEARLVPAVPRRGGRGRARATCDSRRRARPRRLAGRHAAAPRRGRRSALRQRLSSSAGHVYGLGGRDLHPPDVRAVFAGPRLRHIGLRGERCPV